MSRFFLAVNLALLFLSADSWAQTLCNPSQIAEKGCKGPEVCILDSLGTGLRWPSCQVRVSEAVTAKDCLAKPKDKDGKEYSPMCFIDWNGPITQSDVTSLVKFIDTMPLRLNPLSGPRFQIDSEGGDVRAAMQLGRKLRQRVSKIRPFYCASACVLVLAGGSKRTIWPEGKDESKIVIHRPYSLDVNASDIGSEKERYDRLNADIEAYLREMNVPVSLLDAMLAVPSHRGRTLSYEELQGFGIAENDPVFQQFANAVLAKRDGLSMTEFLRREGLYEQCTHRHYVIERKDYFPYYCWEIYRTGDVGVDEGEKSMDEIFNR